MDRDCRLLNLFKEVSCKIVDSHLFSSSGIKMTKGFSVISNLSVTTRVTINYSKAVFFSSESLKQNELLSLHLDLKITFSLQSGKFPSIARLSIVFKSSEVLPKYGKAQVDFPFNQNFHREVETLKSIFKRNNYPKNFVNHCIKKFLVKYLKTQFRKKSAL